MPTDEPNLSPQQAGANGHSSPAFSATAWHDDSSTGDAVARFVREALAINDELAAIERLRRDGDSSPERLVEQCVHVWSRIRQLELELECADS